MPITKSAKKFLRRSREKAIFNARIKKAVKEAIKEFKKKPSENNLRVVYKLLDTARKKNIFHKNKTARLKGRLTKLLKMKMPSKLTPKVKRSKTKLKKR